MWKNPRLLTGLLLTALAAAVVTLGLYLAGTPRGPSRRLPDGTLLTLADVSYGREHHFVHGNRLQRLLYPRLPPPVWERVSCPVYSYRPQMKDHFIFWLARDGVPEVGAELGHWGLRLVAVDEHGYEGQDVLWRSGITPAGVTDWQLGIFPRRGQMVRLRAYQQASGGMTRVAEFSVANPTPGPHPVWRAEPLPVTKRAGSLAITLRQLECGVHGEEPHVAASHGAKGWTVATFDVKENGYSSDDWHVEEVTFSDATGNAVTGEEHSPEYGYYHYPSGTPPGEQVLAFLDALWPGEAWKLRVELARSARYEQRDIARIRGVVAPVLGGTWTPPKQAQRRFTTRVHGTTVRVLSTARTDPDEPNRVRVEVRASGLRPHERVALISSRTEAPRYTFTAHEGEGDGTHELYLEVPPGVRTVDLALAVHRSRFVEFVAQPRRR